MTENKNNDITPIWIEGDLRLAGALDNRVIGLLKAIEQSGSLNQAAKQVGLSYKGAWQIIERANNSSPKTLVATATGGLKGGGTCLTEAGRTLVTLFTDLKQQHQLFIKQLNRSLTENPDTVLLLQRLIVKTSARNQLFGRIIDIHTGAVNSEVIVKLKRGEYINVTVSLSFLNETGLMVGSDAILLINSTDITLVVSDSINQFSACNRLPCRVINIQENKINAEIIVLLEGGETLTVTNSQEGMQNLELKIGMTVWAIFKSNVPILGVKL
ncbi:MAG: TOBE domain-containing protein [Methylococcales bacterium]|nr:TOBE domain-containing protein [Methylococcales bacterium]MDD5754250.1 TOBE domain-containing protein [Methylococcales bacterium]